jgi:L-amino acid N-acyltransferase YncA
VRRPGQTNRGGTAILCACRSFFHNAMSNLSIRPALPHDVAAITRIYAHAVLHGTASFETEPPDEAEMTRRQNVLLAGGFPYLVAEFSGAVAGYAYAGPYRARPAYRFTVEDSIYVEMDAHRHGIGRALLERLLADAQMRGFRQMIAVIGDSAQRPSIALLESLGFRHVGTLEAVGFKFGRWLDTVLMQRALGAGASVPP